MEHSLYHALLRVSALVIAIVLLFDSGLLLPITSQYSENTQQYLANSIGMYAAIEPTELNQLTAQLTEKQRELADREAALAEREISVNLSNGSSGAGADMSTYILSVILFILVVLIVLNYALDFARERKITLSKQHEHAF